MMFETARFGTLEVEDDKIIHFERGLPGFPDCTQFIVLDHDIETPLKWLQCVDRPEVAFLVVEPEQVLSKYQVEVPDAVLQMLGWEQDAEPSDVAVFVILNVDGEKLTANLRAPVIVNIATRRAFQMILEDPSIPLRHPVAPDPLQETDPGLG